MSATKRFQNMKQGEMHSLCREKGLPVTVQRTVIMDALAGRKDHPTADQIYDAVKPQLSGVSRTTVYRVLEAFVAHGLAQKIACSAAKAHFDADVSRHHHLECIRCQAIIDVPHQDAYEIPLPQNPLFNVLGYAIQFRGVCDGCKQQSEE